MQPSVYDLPRLPAHASADQADAWLAAFAKCRVPTAKEQAAQWAHDAELFRRERDNAMRLASTQGDADKVTCLMVLADIAELHAQRCDAEAQQLDPLPF